MPPAQCLRCFVERVWRSREWSSDSNPSDNTNHLETNNKETGCVWHLKITVKFTQGRVWQFWNWTEISLSGKLLYVGTYLPSRRKTCNLSDDSEWFYKFLDSHIHWKYSFSRLSCYSTMFLHKLWSSTGQTFSSASDKQIFRPSPLALCHSFYPDLSVIRIKFLETAKNLEKWNEEKF